MYTVQWMLILNASPKLYGSGLSCDIGVAIYAASVAIYMIIKQKGTDTLVGKYGKTFSVQSASYDSIPNTALFRRVCCF